MTPKKFVGLHAHSGFSTFDGLGSPEEHIDYAVENGMDAMAFTEHGNMASFPQANLYAKELRKKGINFKHIPGVEAYYHPDLDEWEKQKFDHDENKKSSKKSAPADDEEAGAENEEETKNISKWFNPINRRHHMVLLAKSNKGLENLFQLVSKSFKDGFYKFPRIDRKMLKEHGEDIIVTSACLGGFLSYDAMTQFPGVPFDDLKADLLDDKATMNSIVSRMENSCDQIIDAVGKENFFAELQFNKLAPQHIVNRALLELKKKGIQLTAAADSHYCRPELWMEREIYKKLGRLNYDQINPDLLPKDKSALKCELYPKNALQMWQSYKEYCADFSFYDDEVVSSAIENTWHIAHDLIGNVDLDSKMKLPSFVIPKGMTAFNALVEACKEGMRIRGLQAKPEYIQRLKHELTIIKKKEFAQYFLTMKAIIDIAHSSMLVGAGRGSGTGSLVNYVLGITQLDPLKYGLIFERFISPSRKDEPDIDNDVADRDGLIDRMKESFGTENVIPITNFNTLQLKSLIKDISRLHGIPFEESNEVTKYLDEDVRHKANSSGENKSLFQLKYDDCMQYSERFRNFISKYPHIGQHIKVLYKQQKSLGRHAGGVVVIEDANKHMPLITVRKEVQTPWPEGMNIKSLSPYGIIKFDILGLETLRMIQRSIELILQRHENIPSPTWEDINSWYQKNLAPGVVNESDKNVFDHVFRGKRFAGIFQFTAKHTQRFIHEFDPENVNDLAIATAIYRPGPLAAKVDKLYIQAKRDPYKIYYDHPSKEKVFKDTLGYCIFQEQLMEIANELGGLSLDECDKLRKAILKRSVTGMSKNKSESEILEEKFIDGAEKNGYPREKAKAFFEELAKWSSYGFNKSHSVAYAFCSYQTAWLMTYYEAEWLCAYIESMISDPDSRSQAISELKSFGYKIGKVDINHSNYKWIIGEDNKTFIPSFRTVKGVGDVAIDEILANRPYKCVDDLLWNEDNTWRHSKFNKKVFENLIKVEAFDSMDIVGQDKKFENYKQMHFCLVENGPSLKKKSGKDQLNKLIDESSMTDDWSTFEKIAMYKELMGEINVNLIVPVEIQEKLNAKGVSCIDQLEEGTDVVWFVLVDCKKKVTKNKKEYLLITVIDQSAKEHRIFLWGTSDESSIVRNVPYVAEVEKNNFGYSSRITKLKRLL